MPDTPRTLAALQALLADNASADISAQDVRDFLVSVFPQTTKGDLPGIDSAGIIGRLPPTTDGFILTLDAAETYGFKWAAAPAGGVVDADDVTYTPTTLADWDGSADPGDVEQALDQLAERVTDEEAHTHSGLVTNGNSHDHVGGDGAQIDHDNLANVSANDHHNQSHGNGDHTTAFTDDTTVNNHIADTGDAHDASAISVDSTTLVGTGTDVQAVFEELDNAIVDHAAAADPHTGYRLESADHTHESTGAQAGKIDHGNALNGLTDDDHTQYLLASAATDRATFAANWTDLTDSGATTLHSHAGGGAHALLDGSTHSDSAADAVSRGSIIVGNATPAWDEVTVGSANQFVGSDGTDTTFRTITAAMVTADSTTLVGTGTTVQAVFEELDNGIADHLADTTDAHDSDSIAYVPASTADWGGSDPGDVEQALDVLADRTSKQMVYIPAWQLIPSYDRAAWVTTPAVTTVATNDFAYRYLPFSGTAKQYSAGDFPLPPNYDASTLTARFRWKSTGGGGGSTVIWGIQMLAVADDDAHDAAMGTAIEVSDALTTVGDYQRSDSTAAITPSGTAAAADHIFFEVYRDGTNDTNGSDAQLIGIELFFGLTAAGVA